MALADCEALCRMREPNARWATYEATSAERRSARGLSRAHGSARASPVLRGLGNHRRAERRRSTIAERPSTRCVSEVPDHAGHGRNRETLRLPESDRAGVGLVRDKLDGHCRLPPLFGAVVLTRIPPASALN